ncbi:hypothetical protein LX64_02532 [Chitinophaga skermanii]|uniref:Pyridoxal phosphate homeostasis protein n=1 Tax=Chitinophaga skermanii TaxID=331697 RepID=A0A327QNV3_9BACT|nr:YggS family pyridoxal phosphate-dependent enzyme [Chitinophaga skermanii]RAJ05374.1 hypothetical protein LX64_02532 [Chitinophaga skermanii]
MHIINEPSTIITHLHTVKERIHQACLQCNRDPQEVRLLLATKTVPAERIRVAIEAGETLMGENKVQELRDKAPGLADLTIEKHFIGHLQSNKVKDVLKYATCIQSLDRVEIARELEKRLQAMGKPLDVYIQVNTSAEESKFGIAPADIFTFAKQLQSFDTLRVKGLMTIGLLDADPLKMKPSLRLLRRLRNELLQTGIYTALGLSMGMSGDLEMAIAEGATMVRVGTAIFGNRVVPGYVWNEQANQ